MNLKYFTVICTVIASYIVGLGSSASASSYYDDKITSVDQLLVTSVEGTTDLTIDWRDVFTEVLRRQNTTDSLQMLDQFVSNQSQESGWLVQSAYDGMRVITFDPDATVGFEGSWYGADHLTFSMGDICVWETGGAGWKNWMNLDSTYALQNYVSVECDSYSIIHPSYTQYGSNWPYLFIESVNLVYPSGYAGDLIATEAPKAKYVAMGDSFSSGEGNYPFEYGTGADGVNECHRSSVAYPRVLQEDSSLDLDPIAFVACSGATTDDVISGKYNEPPQIDKLSAETDNVTMTIGGNDINFKDFANACVTGSCAVSTTAYSNSWDVMTNSSNSGYLPDKLDNLFAEMQIKLTSSNTGAQVLVIGYPYVAKDDSWTSSCPYFSSASAEGAEAVVNKLNEVIDAAVTRLNDLRFTFVDVNDTGSPFTNHELCTDIGYFNGVDTNNLEYTFHPNASGHSAYKEAVDGYIF